MEQHIFLRIESFIAFEIGVMTCNVISEFELHRLSYGVAI